MKASLQFAAQEDPRLGHRILSVGSISADIPQRLSDLRNVGLRCAGIEPALPLVAGKAGPVMVEF
jgi:hypothetical protein